MSRDRAARMAVVAAAIGAVGSLLGLILAPGAFAFGWLAALSFWLGWPLGSMALLLIHALTGGRWGQVLRPQLVAGTGGVVLVLPFVLPLPFLLRTLYPWSRPDAQASLHNGFYLNLPFFYVRSVLYLVVMLALAAMILGAERRGEPARLRRIAPAGLILLALVVTFGAIDLTMSLDPAFKSSVYGLLVGTEAVLLALSVAVFAAAFAPLAPDHGRVLGKLLLALVVLWAYLDFMQILIVWQSDLPDEAGWYLPRVSGTWAYVAGAIAILHFALPFLLLLAPRLQRSPAALAFVTGMLIAAEMLRAWWLVLPAGRHAIGPVALAAMLAVVGLGVRIALRPPRWPGLVRAEPRHG